MVQRVRGSPDGVTSITLNPMADQVIDKTGFTSPGTNGLHCRSDILRLYRSYLKFDLRGISDFDAIIGAELRLYCEATTIPPPTLDVEMLETGDTLNDGTPWEEMNLVWSNAPIVGDLIATTAVGDKNSWYSWDGSAMVDYVKAECAGDKIISFVIKLAIEDTSIMITPYHRDFADRLKPNAPQLIITFASPMTISGHVFNDLDGDGVKDSGEPALEGWTVNLAGPVSKTTTSDSTGYYEFSGLTPGTYTISEVLQDGWVQTGPAPPGTHTVSLTSSSVTDKDFGNFKLVTITADKWNDLDGDGVKDGDEPEIPGWKLTLHYLDGVTTDTKDSPASWVVEKGGTYTITEELREGWVHTTADSAAITVQSGDAPDTVWFGNFKEATITVYKYEDADGNLATTDDWTPIDWPITLKSGSGEIASSTGTSGKVFSGLGPGHITVTEADDPAWAHLNSSSWSRDVESGGTYEVKFVNFKKGIVCGHKFDDVDGDGSWDNGEPALKGWTINLAGRDMPVGLMAVTDDQGYYEFRELMAGEYIITEEPQAGWLQTTPVGGTYTIKITSGSMVANEDFGNLKLVTITADKFDDLDGDGMRDDGEPEIQDWELKITYPDGTTNTKVSPASWVVEDYGDYTIAEEFQEGWVPTTPSSAVVKVQSRNSPSTVWFGNFKLVTITADKFEDFNGDGFRDGSDPEIAGWKLKILCPNGTISEMGSPASWVVEQGGMYTITEEEREGYVNTTPISVDIMVQSGDTPEKIWFGNFKLVTITADKFEDLDGDWMRDDGEPEIPGWQLTITCPNGTTSTLGSPASWVVKQGGKYTITEELRDGWVQTTASAVDIMVQSGDAPDTVWFGNFKQVTITAGKFNDLNGNGELDADELEISGWKLTLHYPDGVTTDMMDSPASWTVEKGGTYTITEELREGWVHTTADSVTIRIQSGDAPEMVWFGNFELGEINGIKLNDLNGNGFRNEGEPPLEGWTIHLDGYDTITKAEVHRTTVTDHNGYYEFKGLTNGIYTVSEELRPGWIQTKPFGTYTIEITSGTSGHGDFYNFKLGTITADKFEDLDGDGMRDDGEPEIQDWELKITYPDGTTNTMDSPASWLVKKGTYIITEELQDGWIQTTASSESVNVAQSGDTPPTVWFGNFKEATVVVYKYEDADGNLATTDDWTPIDWPVTLTNSSGDWVGSTGTTGKVFYSQKPGFVTVTESEDAAWVCLNSSNTWTKQMESGGTYVVNFVNFKKVTITADKFDDVNGNGKKDDGEPEIPGWQLTIKYPDGTTNTMDSPASWTVGRGGTYTITEELRDGWLQTTASSVDVSIKSGSTQDTIWFGNFKLVTITADKWNDLDGDGVRDRDEPEIKGWKLTIRYPDGTTNTMDSPASWTVKQGGKYTITEAEKSDWVHTTASSVDLVIQSGDTPSTVWFGNRHKCLEFKPVTIKADKWDDIDGDGVRDSGEPEIAGWKLTITCPNGTTSTLGSPASWVVRQGGKYTITEAEKSGWTHTTASSVDLVIQSGDTPSTVWFGNRQECYRKVTNGWLSDTSEQRIEVTDFNIVFTPSKGSYKISSTNPGGFYFNVLYQTGTDPTTIHYTLANNGNGDFVTKGSTPVHAYVWNDLDKDGKVDYWGELTDITNKISTAQEPDLAKGTINIKGVATGTNVLITIHITFALKGTSGYDLNGARAFEGKLYTFTASDGFNVRATLKAHAKI